MRQFGHAQGFLGMESIGQGIFLAFQIIHRFVFNIEQADRTSGDLRLLKFR